jgi:ABC-type Fe3+-siderophore transport system permease subunit
MIDLINLGIGLAALIGGLVMMFVALKRHRRDHRANDPRGVAMLIAGMMVTAFGLFITAFAIAFAFGEPVEAMR